MKKVVIKKYHDFPMEVVEIEGNARKHDHQLLRTIFIADYKPAMDAFIERHNRCIRDSVIALARAGDFQKLIQNLSGEDG